MDEAPRTTLTQRRNEISAGTSAKKISREKISPSEAGLNIDRSAALRVVMWIAAILFVGVGSALLITSVLSNNSNNSANNSAANNSAQDDNDNDPESLPLSSPLATDTEDPEDSATVPAADDTDTATDTATTPTTTTSPTTTGTQVSTLTDFAATDRTLSAQTTGNNLILNKFKFYSESGTFYYQFYNVTTSSGEIDPSISLVYDEDNNLTLELKNVRRDNVTGGGNKTSRTITGVKGLKGTETENSGSVSKYKFLTTEKLSSRVLIDQEDTTITLELQLPK